MSASFKLYQTLHRAGLAVSTDGTKLVVAPAELLSDELRADIRVHKADLIELLQSEHHISGRFLDWKVELDPTTPMAAVIRFRTASLKHDEKFK